MAKRNDQADQNDLPTSYYLRLPYTKLSLLRKERSVTQKELSKRLGITQGTLSHIETGRMTVPVELANKLSAAFDFQNPKELLENLWARLDMPVDGKTLMHKMGIIDHGSFGVVGSNVNFKTNGVTTGDPKFGKPLLSEAKIPRYSYDQGIYGYDKLNSGTRISENFDSMTPPPILQHIDGAYMLEIHSNEMSPKYTNGDVLMVNPTLPPIEGDDVAIQLHLADKTIAVVRHLETLQFSEDIEGDDKLTNYHLTCWRDYFDVNFELGRADIDADMHGESLDIEAEGSEMLDERSMKISLKSDGTVVSIDGQTEARRIIPQKLPLLNDDNQLSAIVNEASEMEANASILKASVHVIVGSYHKQRSLELRATNDGSAQKTRKSFVPR